MGSSRAAAGHLLGFLGDVQRFGTSQALSSRNLGHLSNRPIADILIGLTDVICPRGGPIDEGISRYAWFETIAEFATLGIETLDTLSDRDLRQIVVVFVTKTILARIINDVGTRAIVLPSDVEAVANVQAQLEAYVSRAVEDAFSSQVDDLGSITTDKAALKMDGIYETSFELLEAMGEAL